MLHAKSNALSGAMWAESAGRRAVRYRAERAETTARYFERGMLLRYIRLVFRHRVDGWRGVRR